MLILSGQGKVAVKIQAILQSNRHTVILFWVTVMVLNATFSNIWVISWQSVLLMEETRVLWENHRPVSSHWKTFSHNVVSSTPPYEWDSNSQHKWW